MTWESELQRVAQEHWAQRARLRRAIDTALLNGASADAIAHVLGYSVQDLQVLGMLPRNLKPFNEKKRA